MGEGQRQAEKRTPGWAGSPGVMTQHKGSRFTHWATQAPLEKNLNAVIFLLQMGRECEIIYQSWTWVKKKTKNI